MDLASGDLATPMLPATLPLMLGGSIGGDALPAELLYQPGANFGMLPATGDGDGLSANATTDIPVAMNLADGSGGTALVPTLSVVVPIMWHVTGPGASGFVNTGGVNLSWSHTKNAADNCVIVPLLCQSQSPYTAKSRTVDYGGSSMTSLGVVNYGFDGSVCVWMEWFYTLSPASGAQTVTLTVSDTSDFTQVGANSLSYSNVGSIGTLDSEAAASSILSHTVTSATGRVVVRAVSCYQNVYSGNQTVRDSAADHYIQEAPGVASVNFTASVVVSSGYASGIIQLLP